MSKDPPILPGKASNRSRTKLGCAIVPAIGCGLISVIVIIAIISAMIGGAVSKTQDVTGAPQSAPLASTIPLPLTAKEKAIKNSEDYLIRLMHAKPGQLQFLDEVATYNDPEVTNQNYAITVMLEVRYLEAAGRGLAILQKDASIPPDLVQKKWRSL